jgi:hypothetical protein
MKYSQQLYYKQNEVTICNAWKSRTPEFEPILGSENSFSTETKWNSFSNSR